MKKSLFKFLLYWGSSIQGPNKVSCINVCVCVCVFVYLSLKLADLFILALQLMICLLQLFIGLFPLHVNCFCFVLQLTDRQSDRQKDRQTYDFSRQLNVNFLCSVYFLSELTDRIHQFVRIRQKRHIPLIYWHVTLGTIQFNLTFWGWSKKQI